MIRFLDLQRITRRYQEEIYAAVSRVISSGRYLLGDETKKFEKDYARYIGTTHAVGCGNGLDALTLIFRAYIELGLLSSGDEIIVPANTFIASILAITENGLTPVLAEPDPATFQIDPAEVERLVSPRTRGVMLVHLYGRCAYSLRIADLCSRHGLLLVEDNAQAHGCLYHGRRTGSLGNAAAHSFYPGKNLGALGDGGAVTTDDGELARMVRALANYGSSSKYIFAWRGQNSRLDEVQAAVLRVKLRYLDSDNQRRRDVAAMYYRGITNRDVVTPVEAPEGENVFHIFPVLSDRRDFLQEYLANNGVETLIHYPLPPHNQKCFSEWGERSYPVTERIHRQELSLPVSPVITDEEVERVVSLINRF